MRPRDQLRRALKERCVELGWPTYDIIVERPKDPEHGDWSTPTPLTLARPLGRPPREIAEELLEGLKLDREVFSEASVAGAGFINFRLDQNYLRKNIQRILADMGQFARSDQFAHQTINVEFVSSNPTGPLHVGHARNAVLGDTIASLLESQGAEVTREYYFNDAGRQMDVLGASIHARYQQQWDPDYPFPEDGYQGAYIEDLARAFTDAEGHKYRGVAVDECLEVFRSFGGAQMSAAIRRDLERFRVGFDVWFNESTLYDDGRLDDTIEALRAQDAVYEAEGAIWLRASDYGDTDDRVLVKSSGMPTYLLPDIAYHLDKHERGFDRAVNIWGADHHSYQVRMNAALAALGYEEGWLEAIIYQQVSLVEDGQEVRLSTRANRMVTLQELLDDIGVDVTRYFLIMRKGDTHMVFDLDLAREQSDENPVYYVQYAHARIASVFDKLERPEWDPIESGVPDDLGRLEADTEIELLRVLDDFPDVIADAARALEPHRVTDYLERLARRFHLWYHEERFLVEDAETARARLALARATQSVIGTGLAQLGVSAPEAM